MTCRVRWHNREALETLGKADHGFVLCMWHNCSTIAGWVMRNSDISVIVSESRDGEYVSRLANLFGISTIRGSSSAGSSNAVRAALSLLSKKQAIAVTPDGPRGPKYKMQSGALWFAASNKVPILPLHIESTRQWVLGSWDNHRFPKPFSSIHVSVGMPYPIDREDLESDINKVTQEVEKEMMQNVEKVRAALVKAQ